MNRSVLVVDFSKEAIRQITEVVMAAEEYSIIGYIIKSSTRKECDQSIQNVMELVEKDRPSIVITRIAWPGFDGQGFRLSAKIKQKFPNIVIIGINEPVLFWKDYVERKKTSEMDYLLQQPLGKSPSIIQTILFDLEIKKLLPQ